MAMRSWPQLCCLLVLALSVQSATAFLTPRLLPHQNHISLRPARCHGGVVCARPGAARRLPLLLPAGAQHSRRRASTPRSFPEEVTAATGVGGLLRGDSVRGHGRRGASTALALGANGGMRGEGGGERSPVGGGGGGGKGGWRQRIVRTVMTMFLTVRAMVALVASRLGLGRPGAGKGVSNQSLFRGVQGKGKGSQASGGKKNLAKKKTAVLVAMVVVAFAARTVAMRGPAVSEVPMSTFMQLMDGKQGKAAVDGIRVAASGKMFYRMNGKQCYTQPLNLSKEVFKALSKSGIPFSATKAPPVASRTLSAVFPIMYIFAIYFFVFKKGQRDMVGTTGKLASSSELDRSLTFGDVAGVDQAKSQVQELVSMIKNPGPFIAAGARLPSGLLMVGPPGTGKTLMARVMASEAGVPFYYCSGSDFVEMYVGRGAARVRKLFVKAAKTAPCIIFLDELDALGKERSAGGGGRQTNDEAEQTLNQLLACMDGLDTNNNGVMVIAATNRFEVLDNALTRPGRFDRIVRVDVPDSTGREAILKVHTRNMRVEDPAVLRAVAETTPGLAGAELATIANEAAISAARRGSQSLIPEDFLNSVQNFYVSRKRGVPGLQNLLKGMLQ